MAGFDAYSSLPISKLSAIEWDEENTCCYQVEIRGILLSRRKDNSMINGTKLLNIVGMTRGKRDGILKNELGRVVVKSGSMILKGVWLPISRGIELAKEYMIFDCLYPLFEENIESFYYSNFPLNSKPRPLPLNLVPMSNYSLDSQNPNESFYYNPNDQYSFHHPLSSSSSFDTYHRNGHFNSNQQSPDQPYHILNTLSPFTTPLNYPFFPNISSPDSPTVIVHQSQLSQPRPNRSHPSYLSHQS